MTFQEAARYLLARAADRGVAIEVFAQRDASTTIKAFNQDVDEFKLAERVGLGIRALVGGAWGNAYTENLGQEALERALDAAIENAELVAPEEKATLDHWPEAPEVADLYGTGLADVGVDRKVQLAMTLEAAARDADPRVKSVPYAAYSDGDQEITVANSKGLARSYRSNYAIQYVGPLVEENGQNKMKWDWQFSRDFNHLDPTETALEAVSKAIALLGAEPIESGTYPVVIDRECMAELLGTFQGMFSAKMVQEGKSLLAGKEGQRIGAARVTIVDDATLPGGMASRPFDAEGYPSQRLTLVRAGILQSFLHNTETAAKAGVTSTGHASRASYKGTIDVAPTNLYLEPGDGERADLIGRIERGVLLTGVMGTHAGASVATGDFSLQAEGFVIAEGAIATPIEVFTVAGNFLDLLGDIEAVADDLKFDWSGVGAPSVRVKKLAIGGK